MTIQRKVASGPAASAPPATMPSITYRRYGGPDVLEFGETPVPTPAAGEVRIAVRAASVNPYDWHWMRGLPYLVRAMGGWRAPKDPRLGVDVAGVVDEVGPGVTEFSAGDHVFGIGTGTLAGHAVARAAHLARKPESISFEQAASVPLAALTALQGLRDHAGVTRGTRVLVIGASGGVGTFAVQIARELGAEVNAVCSTRNVELVRGLGARRVYDYTREDPTTGHERYDVIVDIAGGAPLTRLRKVLRARGTVLLVGGPDGGRLLGPAARIYAGVLRGRFVRARVLNFMVRWDGDDLRFLAEPLAAGRIAPVVDRTYPLAEAARAIAYLEEGHARGKVVVTTA